MNIYEITQDFKRLQELAESGELDGEVIKDTLDGIEGNLEEKCNSYAKVLTNLSADVEALKTEEKRIAERRKSIESNVKRLKETLRDALIACDKRKLKTDLFTFSVAKSGARPVVVDCEASELPKEFQKITIDVDKSAIKECLESGKELEFAHFGEQSEALRIK